MECRLIWNKKNNRKHFSKRLQHSKIRKKNEGVWRLSQCSVSMCIWVCIRRLCVSVQLLTLGQVLCEQEAERRGGTRTRSKQTLGSVVAPSGVECRSANRDLLTRRTPAQWRGHRDNYGTFCLANLLSSRQSVLNKAQDETAPVCACVCARLPRVYVIYMEMKRQNMKDKRTWGAVRL